MSIGKNRAKTGTKIVPSPKPEKRVSPEPKSATKQIIIYSVIVLLDGNFLCITGNYQIRIFGIHSMICFLSFYFLYY